MRIEYIQNVDARAEGDCAGFPYNTELANSHGCSILFWAGGNDLASIPTKTALETALRTAKRNRDIVCAYVTDGFPSGYWAHENMPS